MWNESARCLAVYATDKALSAEPAPLIPSLRQFAKADNKLFHQELAQEARQQDASAADDTTAANGHDLAAFLESPAKRKRTSGSVDSMSSNRAFVSDSDTDTELNVQPSSVFPRMMQHGNSSTAHLVGYMNDDEDLVARDYDEIVGLAAVPPPPSPSLRPAKRPAVTVTSYVPGAASASPVGQGGADSPILGHTAAVGMVPDAAHSVFDEWVTSPRGGLGADSVPDLVPDSTSTIATDTGPSSPMPPRDVGGSAPAIAVESLADDGAEEAEAVVEMLEVAERAERESTAGGGAVLEMRERDGGIPFFAADATMASRSPSVQGGRGGEEEGMDGVDASLVKEEGMDVDAL
jgi:hypothetical protein